MLNDTLSEDIEIRTGFYIQLFSLIHHLIGEPIVLSDTILYLLTNL